MKLLGIDYGRKKIGMAVGDTETKFAEPLMVLRFQKIEQALEKINEIAQIEKIQKLILGVSEGEMAKESKVFGTSLSKKLKLPMTFQDETLSTHDASMLSIEAGMKRVKRKKMEDAYAASIMLQGYLDKLR